jgi:hypothetical protein
VQGTKDRRLLIRSRRPKRKVAELELQKQEKRRRRRRRKNEDVE